MRHPSRLRSLAIYLLLFWGAHSLSNAQTVAVWNPTVTTGTANGTGSNYNNAANWTVTSGTNPYPGSTTAGSTTNTDTATFNNGQYANGLTTVANIPTGTALNIQNINFGNPTGSTVSPAKSYYVAGASGLNLTSGGAITATSNFNGIASVNDPITLEDSGATTTGSYSFTSNTPTFTSGLTISNSIAPVAGTTAYTLNLNGSSTYLNSVQGVISGNLTLVKSGSGTWVLDNNNTYTGGTTLNNGTLIDSTANSLGTTGAITFAGNSTLDLQASASPAGDLSARLIIGQGVTATLDVANNGYLFNSGFGANGATGTGTAGSGSLTKTGVSSLTLTAPESYTGTTTLNGGTLSLSENNTLDNAATSGTGGSASGADTAIISSSSALSLGGGTLNFTLRNTGSATSGTTNGAVASGATSLVLTSAANLAVGQTVTGLGIAAGTYITALNGTTAYLSAPTTLAVASGTALVYTTTAPTDTLSQTFASTAVTAGYNNISFNNYSSSRTIALNLGAITRSTGSILNINTGTGLTITTSSANDAGGNLHGVFNSGNDFARQNAGTIGQAAYTIATNASNWISKTVNYQVNGAVTGTLGTVTLNGIQFQTNGNGFTINQAGTTLSLNDGLIFGNNIGNNVSTLTGGSITAGTTANGGTNNELILVNDNNQSNAVGGVNQIASAITDNGSAVSVDLEAVQGQLGIGGTSTTSGTVETYTGNTYVSGPGSVVLSGTIGGGTTAGVTYINGGGTLTIGNGGTTGDVIGGIQLDYGTLNFNRTDAKTLSSTVNSTVGMGGLLQSGTGNETVNVANGSTLGSVRDVSTGNLILKSTGTVYLDGETANKALSTTGTGVIDINSGIWYATQPQTTINLTVDGSGTFEFSQGRGVGGNWNINNGGTVIFDNGNNGIGNSGRFSFGINAADTLTLGSGGTLNVYGSNYGFYLNNGVSGTTVFNQTGGSLIVGVNVVNNGNPVSLGLGIGTSTAGDNATYNLSGGTAVIAGNIYGSGTSTDTFTFTGGTLTANGINLTNLNSGSLTINGTSSSNLAILAPSDSPYYTGLTTLTPGTGGAVTLGANSELSFTVGGTTTAASQFHDLNTKYDQIKIAATGAATNLKLGGLLSVSGINGFNLQTGLASSTITIISDGTTNGISTASNFSNATADYSGVTGSSRVALAGDSGLGTYQIVNNGTTVTFGNYSATNYWLGFGGGNWNTGVNAWQTAIPANNSFLADFDDVNANPVNYTAILDQNTTVRGLIFNSSLPGVSSSSFTIAQGGSNTLTLDGTTNTATTQGTATIAAGTSTVTDTQGSQSINVPVALATNVATYVANSGDSVTYNGVISGTGGMIANGPGSVILNGNNTYTGPTTINNGIFQVNGNDTASTGIVTVQALTGGTTAVLEGTGKIGGAINVGSSTGTSAIAPGTIGTIGTLTALGNVTAVSKATFDFDINSSGPVTAGVGTSDLLKVAGLLSLGTSLSTLNVTDLGSSAVAVGTVFELAQFGTESGTFNGLADNAVYSLSGNNYQINYGTLAGYSNFLTLTPVPEPKPWLLIMVLAMGLLVYRRWQASRTLAQDPLPVLE